MAEKPKRGQVFPPQGGSFPKQLIDQLRLTWALMTDRRVPVMLKLIPIAAVIYVISPIDFIPDVIPVLGQLDDLAVLMGAISLFNNLAPADIVQEHTGSRIINIAQGTELPDEEGDHARLR